LTELNSKNMINKTQLHCVIFSFSIRKDDTILFHDFKKYNFVPYSMGTKRHACLKTE
jgi:hypothetical protein